MVSPSPFPATDPHYSIKDLTAILAIYSGVRIIFTPTCDDCYLDGLGQKETSSKHGQALGKLPIQKTSVRACAMSIDSGLYNYYNPASLYVAIEASVSSLRAAKRVY
ncbi:hypothetical protein CU280_10495 [Yersinia mollaretii]|nr:hypothetical protein CU280_10495 [Yersinia mollaretii]